MPDFCDHQSSDTTKLLLIGESGVGKTGALASLIKAGYKLRILDFDNGLDILRGVLGTYKPQPGQVIFETLTDKRKAVNGKPIPDGLPVAFAKGLDLLTEWKLPERKIKTTNLAGEEVEKVLPAYNLGKITSWGSDVVLVIDSLSLMGDAALRHVLALNGRLLTAPQLNDWGDAIRMLEDTLGLLYSDAIRCHVIITSHITFVGADDAGGVQKGYPNALGSKLPPKVGRYFNAVLGVRTKGSGANVKRVIRTQSEGLVEFKNPAPLKVPVELPIETGLADYFKIVQEG